MINAVGINAFCFLIFLITQENHVQGRHLEKRSAAPERTTDDFPDYQLGIRYDEYPMIVPRKRAALLLDRLMVALQKAIEEEEELEGASRNKNFGVRPEDAVRSVLNIKLQPLLYC